MICLVEQRRWLALGQYPDDDILLPWLYTDIMVHALRVLSSCISRIPDKTSMGLLDAVYILGARVLLCFMTRVIAPT